MIAGVQTQISTPGIQIGMHAKFISLKGEGACERGAYGLSRCESLSELSGGVACDEGRQVKTPAHFFVYLYRGT